MFTVDGRVQHQIDPVKGSRFITTAAPVSSEDEARQLVSEVAAEMPDASHHCTAWRIASPAIDRCNDDGEPGGSAGRPILAQLTGRNLVNVAVVVTRYFGGTKLGVGGLVRAYGAAAAATLDTATVLPYTPTVSCLVTVAYSDTDRVFRAIEEVGVAGGAPTYGEVVVFTVAVPDNALDTLRQTLADATAGRARIDEAD